MKDYYQRLGVSRGASQDEIKKAYRRLAKQYHPDVNKGDKSKEEKFKEITEAYDVLSDPEKRRQYDMFGGMGSSGRQGGFDPFGGARGFEWGDGGTRFYSYTTGGGQSPFEDLGDIFSELFGIGGFGRRRGSEEYSERKKVVDGSDTYADIEIGFEEAAKGTVREIAIKRGDKVERIKVKIPAGVDNGFKVRVKGKGEPGIGGGRPGDLYLSVRVRPHHVFWREGADVYCEVPISIYESIFGGSITVPTLNGSAVMKLPPYTSSGQKFRLRGQGVPVPGKEGVKGDQYVIVNIVPPKKLDRESEAMLRELASRNAYNPREEK
jgi:curved DNA-binding protein